MSWLNAIIISIQFLLLFFTHPCFSQSGVTNAVDLLEVQPLSGKAGFYWHQLLNPEDFTNNNASASPLIIPQSWTSLGFPHQGYGTYRIQIRLPHKAYNHSIFFPVINSSAKVWLNGRFVDELGVCSANKQKYRAQLGSLMVAVPSDTLFIDLVIQVVNFSYSSGGIIRAPQLGPTTKLLTDVNSTRGVENFFVGSLMAMFIYQIILFFLYQKGKAYLYLALICLIVALRAMVTHGGSFILPDLFPQISFEVWKKLEFFSVYSIVAIFPLYSFHLFPVFSYKKPIPFFIGLSVILCSLVIFTRHEIYVLVLDVFHVALLLGFAYAIAVVLRSWRGGNKDARIILWGVIAAFPFIFLEMIQNSRILNIDISFSYLVEIGVLVFLLFQVFLLANHYAVAYKNLESINIDLEGKVQQRTQELVAANQVREKLLSVVSHDIKSPLYSLKGILNIYQKGGVSDQEMKNFTGHIEDDLTTTILLVDNILLWSSNQLKGVRVKITSVDLSLLVKDHFRIYENAALRKKVTLKNSVPLMHVNTDANIISLVLRNLLANAIKFSQEKGIVEVTGWQDDRHFRIQITDEGTGMSEDFVQSLYNAKTVVSTEGTQKEKGTGLGLALCFEYLKYLHGEIEIDSKENVGTSFTIKVPIQNL